MTKRFYVTTPIYYVNDVPHIGHAYTTIAADVIARHHRQLGEDVFFLTGTDEHGQKIGRTAQESGEKPIELANRVVLRFKDLWEKLGITNDDFIRTTEDRHKKAVWEIFKKIRDTGDIYLGVYEGWYDVRNEAFITDSQYEECMELPESARPPLERLREESYFFRLSNYQQPLLEYYKAHPEFIRPINRRNEVISFVEGGLRDLSISRTTFSWGIPVPEDSKHIIYVWFDALTNYLTAAGFPDNMEQFGSTWPADLHLVGKDILRFHTVYWPAFLMSAGLPLPHQVFAHGWWTVDGEKMSKSLGNVVDPYRVIDEFGEDIFRYFLLREIPFGQDGDFSRGAIIGRINADLANGLGNLLSRTLGMIEKYAESRIPFPGGLESSDEEIKSRTLSTSQTVAVSLGEIAYNKALVAIWDLISLMNKYIDESAPWVLWKKGSIDRLNTVLWVLVETLRIIAILIYPFIPKSAQKIWERLGFESALEDERFQGALVWGKIKTGSKIDRGPVLFSRYEVKT